MRFRVCCYASILLLITTVAKPQSRSGMIFWDVDRLYDTIPALFYDDSDFTPEGVMGWSGERYREKIRNTAAVIDSISLPLVGLYGVENEAVVRDLVEACRDDYCYIHRTRNSFDGLDFALLYFGDRFFPEEEDAQRDFLYIRGEMDGDMLSIVLTKDGRDLDSYDPILDGRDSERIVVMGRFHHSELHDLGFSDRLYDAAKRGQGNAYGFRGWYMRDRVAVNPSVEVVKAGVYIAPWLLRADNLSPLKSFERREYIGGYSSYLPIYLFFR